MQAGEMQAGEMQAGEMQAGEMQAGEIQAGEMQAGEMQAGEMPAGTSMISEAQWTQIDFAWEHGCGLTNHNQVSCWGRNQQGQASPITSLGNQGFLKRVSVGRYHSCAELVSSSSVVEMPETDSSSDSEIEEIEESTVIQCWGRNTEGQLNPPENVTLSQVSAGWRETCALDSEGQVHCWGDVNPNTLPSTELRLKSIKLSQAFGCGLDKDDGSIHCWGRNDYRQAEPPEGDGYKALSVGTGKHHCAIAQDDLLRCWGDSADGKTLAPALEVKQVSVGQDHACALTLDDTVRCWGINRHGESSAPSGTFQWVSAGPHFSCGLRTEGNLVCWGALTPEASPLFTQVSIGLAHSCALKVDQSLNCWGWPRAGRTEPPTGQFKAVSVGDEHSCAVSLDGQVQCWGLGLDPSRFERDGDFDQAYPPEFNEAIATVSVGALHSCVLSESGTVTCWGSNEFGQAAVPNIPWDVTQLDSGRSHTCARSAEGEVLCWGANQYGQLNPPEIEMTDDAEQSVVYSEIDLGGNTSCGLSVEQTIACWGEQNQELSQEQFSHYSIGEKIICSRSISGDDLESNQRTYCETTVKHSTLSSEIWRFELDDTQIKSLESGYGQACVIRADERIRCQGQHAPNAYPIIFE